MESHQSPALEKIKPNARGKKITRFLVVAIISSSLLLLLRFLTIQQIECQSQGKTCSVETYNKLNKLKNASLFFTNFEEKLADFKVISLKKRLPQTLVLEVEEAVANYYALAGAEVKQVEYDQRDEQLTPLANDLVNGLVREQINFNKIELISQVFIVYLQDDGYDYRALIDSTDVQTGLYRLKTTLNHVDFKADVDVSIKEIDTRFKLPVLKTQFTSL